VESNGGSGSTFSYEVTTGALTFTWYKTDITTPGETWEFRVIAVNEKGSS